MTHEITPGVEAERAAELERLRAESGGPQSSAGEVVAAEEVQFIDTFNFVGEICSYFPGQERLPDAYRQYVVLRKMSNSVRGQVERETSNKITMKGANRDYEIPMDPARDRWARIKHSVTGWFVMERVDGKWVEAPFSKSRFVSWYENADPSIIEKIEADIRELNPWMTQEMTVEAIEAEIERLTEVLAKKKEAELSKSYL
jgi:hypothetical protein